MNVPEPLERNSVICTDVVHGDEVLAAVPVGVQHGDVRAGKSRTEGCWGPQGAAGWHCCKTPRRRPAGGQSSPGYFEPFSHGPKVTSAPASPESRTAGPEKPPLDRPVRMVSAPALVWTARSWMPSAFQSTTCTEAIPVKPAPIWTGAKDSGAGRASVETAVSVSAYDVGRGLN